MVHQFQVCKLADWFVLLVMRLLGTCEWNSQLTIQVFCDVMLWHLASSSGCFKGF